MRIRYFKREICALISIGGAFPTLLIDSRNLLHPQLFPLPFPHPIQQQKTADREADHCQQSGRQCNRRMEMKVVGEDRGERAEQARGIEPYGSVHPPGGFGAKTYLQKRGRQPDGGDHHDRNRTVKSSTAGVEDYQRQCREKDARCDDGPAAREIGV